MKDINLKSLLITVFAISWLGVLPQLLIAYEIAIPAFLGYFEILMTLGPILGAVIFIYKTQGTSGLKSFFRRLLLLKAPTGVVVFTILFPILLGLISSVVGLKISNTPWPEAFTWSTIASNGLMIFVMYLIINTEELVWRGIVFDKLLDSYGFVKSCLILIPIWWVFHIPLFLFPEGHQAGYGLIEFTALVVALTFILGWIYVKTKRSLFYVHIHHQLMNGFGQAFPIFPVFILGNKYPLVVFCLLLLITGGITLLSLRKKHPKEMKQSVSK